MNRAHATPCSDTRPWLDQCHVKIQPSMNGTEQPNKALFDLLPTPTRPD